MTMFRMEDGTVINTDKASGQWAEATDWNGSNHISRATGDQWVHQELYRSRKGRYYLIHSSQWQGSQDHAEWISPQEATRWLLANDHKIPEDLAEYVDDIEE